MTDKDIRSEIEELKAQLESFSRCGSKAVEDQPAAGAAPGPVDDPEDAGAGGWLRDILKQAEDIMGGFDLQLKDVPAKTALMIFALGVLTGRMLSKRE